MKSSFDTIRAPAATLHMPAGGREFHSGLDGGVLIPVNPRHMRPFRLLRRRAPGELPPAGGRRHSIAIGLLLVASLALLCTGLWMPAFAVKTLFIKSQYSLIEGIVSFLEAEEYFLFLIVAFFSVVLPAVKLAVLIAVWAGGDHAGRNARKALRFVAAVSKWSMLDVFIVAVMVMALDGNLFTTAEVHSGVAFFAAAIVLSTVAALWLNARLASADAERDGKTSGVPPSAPSLIEEGPRVRDLIGGDRR